MRHVLLHVSHSASSPLSHASVGPPENKHIRACISGARERIAIVRNPICRECKKKENTVSCTLFDEWNLGSTKAVFARLFLVSPAPAEFFERNSGSFSLARAKRLSRPTISFFSFFSLLPFQLCHGLSRIKYRYINRRRLDRFAVNGSVTW